MLVLWLKTDFGNMRYRRLGKTNLNVSAIGLGTWALGGGYDWGKTSSQTVQETIDAAFDAGINLIDTAPIYGDSEELLGCALKGRRQGIFLSTKCGLVKNGSWTDHDLRLETITAQLENSLRLLRTDYIDIYLIHYLDPKVPWQVTLNTLSKLQTQGKIRHIGACNIPPDILEEMARAGVISCVQEELSLLHPQKARRILEICRAYDLGFMAYGPLCGGILSGKYQREPNLRRADARNYFYKCYRGDDFVRAQTIVRRVQEVASQKQALPAQVALAWVLAQEGVTCALPGARSAMQVQQNAGTYGVQLNAEGICSLQR